MAEVFELFLGIITDFGQLGYAVPFINRIACTGIRRGSTVAFITPYFIVANEIKDQFSYAATGSLFY